MADSIIDLLPKVVSEGRREANRILEGLSSNSRVTLQTNELVIPNKDVAQQKLRGESAANDSTADTWRNRLIYGDNLLVMQALLAGDPAEEPREVDFESEIKSALAASLSR